MIFMAAAVSIPSRVPKETILSVCIISRMKKNEIEIIDGNGGTDIIAGTKGGDTIDLSGTELTGIDHIEGDGGEDTIIGTDKRDVLYGGSKDAVEDYAPDRLEGGKRHDIYHVGIGDTVFDSDHNGTIYLLDKKLKKMTLAQQGENLNFYQDEDDRFRAVVNDNGSLTLIQTSNNFSFTIDGFSSGDFGITLDQWQEPEREYDYTMNGLEVEGNTYRGRDYFGQEEFTFGIKDVGSENMAGYYNHNLVLGNGYTPGMSSIKLKYLSQSPTFEISGKDGMDRMIGFSGGDHFEGGSGNDLLLGHTTPYLDDENTQRFFSVPKEIEGDILVKRGQSKIIFCLKYDIS